MTLLDHLHISIESLSIAGGLLLSAVAVRLVDGLRSLVRRGV
ncbi:MAG: hypothetical protein M3P85_10185 [Actinomycetota bacterium]|nr:hypothetical protein [Actinomycetota bacterium]